MKQYLLNLQNDVASSYRKSNIILKQLVEAKHFGDQLYRVVY